MTINEIQDLIIKELNAQEEWFDKYNYIISQGDILKTPDAGLRSEENAIPGCQSNVWVSAYLQDGKVRFEADSDAKITKGIAALFVRIFDNQTASDIIDADLYFIQQTGLGVSLSPSRVNGLFSIIKYMKRCAEQYLR